MSSLTLRRVNVSLYVKVLGVLLFAVATAISARVSVLLPFSPVPLTLQVLVVLLSGLVLGATGGLLSQLLYLQAILLGAPLTAAGLAGPAAFLSPTAGYLVAFPVAAAATAVVAGYLSQHSGSLRLVWRVLGGLVGLAIIYGLGTAWLSGFVGGLRHAWALGVAPFLGVDLLKLVVASAVLSARGR